MLFHFRRVYYLRRFGACCFQNHQSFAIFRQLIGTCYVHSPLREYILYISMLPGDCVAGQYATSSSLMLHHDCKYFVRRFTWLHTIAIMGNAGYSVAFYRPWTWVRRLVTFWVTIFNDIEQKWANKFHVTLKETFAGYILTYLGNCWGQKEERSKKSVPPPPHTHMRKLLIYL